MNQYTKTKGLDSREVTSLPKCQHVIKMIAENNRDSILLIGTLRSNDADGNANVKKTICLISKTTTSHAHHAFLYISFLFLHDCDVKMPIFAFYGGRKQAATKFYFSF